MASTPVVVDAGITVTDADSATLTSASVKITGGFQAGEDELALVEDPSSMGDITTGIYDYIDGELILVSHNGATPLQWQAALRAVTYTNTSVAKGQTYRYQVRACDNSNCSGFSNIVQIRVR